MTIFLLILLCLCLVMLIFATERANFFAHQLDDAERHIRWLTHKLWHGRHRDQDGADADWWKK